MTTTAQTPEDGPTADGVLLSLVYVSIATVPFSELDLALLLSTSRANNGPREVTGLLLFSEGTFMQALEGPERAVRDTLAIIAADPRHSQVRTLEEVRVDNRRFGSWSMGYRSSAELGVDARSWFGSPEATNPRQGSREAELLAQFRAASMA